MTLPLHNDWISILERFAPSDRLRIGVGLIDPHKVEQEDLDLVRSLADIVVVGSEIDGFECIVTDQVEDTLVSLLKENAVQGIVKIDTGGIRLRNLYRQAFGLDRVNRGCLVTYRARIPNQRQRVDHTAMIYPVSPEEGADREARKQGIVDSVGELRLFHDGPIHIGVLALCRHHTARDPDYHPEALRSYEEAEWLVSELKDPAAGVSCTNYAIDLECALIKCDIISPFRGSYGGIFVRTLFFASDAQEIATPSFVAHPYVGGTNHLGNLAMRVRYAIGKWGATRTHSTDL